MRLSRLCVILVAFLVACGSADDPPSGPRIFGAIDAEPHSIRVRGDHVYWFDSDQSPAVTYRLRRSPVDSFAAETLYETADDIVAWDVAGTNAFLTSRAGVSTRIPLDGGAPERVSYLGDSWVVAGDRVMSAGRTEGDDHLIDVTRPDSPVDIRSLGTAEAQLVMGSPGHVLVTNGGSMSSGLVTFTVPGGVLGNTGATAKDTALAMDGPDVYWREETVDGARRRVLMRGPSQYAEAPQSIASVAVGGGRVHLVYGEQSYRLARLDPPTTPGGAATLVTLPNTPSHGYLAADDEVLFWFERADGQVQLMIDRD